MDGLGGIEADTALLRRFLGQVRRALDFAVHFESLLLPHLASPESDLHWRENLRAAWKVEEESISGLLAKLQPDSSAIREIAPGLEREGLRGSSLQFKLDAIAYVAQAQVGRDSEGRVVTLATIVGFDHEFEIARYGTAPNVKAEHTDWDSRWGKRPRSWWTRLKHRLGWFLEIADELLKSLLTALGAGGALDEFKGVLEKLLKRDHGRHRSLKVAVTVVLAFGAGLAVGASLLPHLSSFW